MKRACISYLVAMTLADNVSRTARWILLLAAFTFVQSHGQGGTSSNDSRDYTDYMHFVRQDVAIAEVQADWNRLETSEYTIHYPRDWTEVPPGTMGTVFTILSPLGVGDYFRENVNLVTEDLRGMTIGLQEYADLSIEGIKAMVTNAAIIDEELSDSVNGEFYRVDVTGTQGKYDLRFIQYYIIDRGTAYVLTFTCEENEFGNFSGIGEDILASFRLK